MARYHITIGFSDVIARFGDIRNASSETVQRLLYEGLAWAVSDAFIACEDSATSLLVLTSI